MDNPSAEEFWKALRKELKITASMPFFFSLIVVNAWNVPGPLRSTWPRITPLPMEFCRERGKTVLFHSCLSSQDLFFGRPGFTLLLLLPQVICCKSQEGLDSSMLSIQTVTVSEALSDEFQGEQLERQRGPVTG